MIKFARFQSLLSFLLILGLLGACEQPSTSGATSPTVPSPRAGQSVTTEGNDVDLSHFPVTIGTCGRSITFNAPPQRVVTNDVNITELFLVLDLQDRLVGYSSIRNETAAFPRVPGQTRRGALTGGTLPQPRSADGCRAGLVSGRVALWLVRREWLDARKPGQSWHSDLCDYRVLHP